MQATTTLMTIEQLLASPEGAKPVELVAGVIRPMTPTGGAHGLISSRILFALSSIVLTNELGALFTEETAFVLKRNPDTLRCPDVAYVAASRLPARGVGFGWMQMAPDLAVEVLSPSDSASEVGAKVHEYLQAGVGLVWVIDPKARTVTVYEPSGQVRVREESDRLDGGSLLPEFSCQIESLFVGVERV